MVCQQSLLSTLHNFHTNSKKQIPPFSNGGNDVPVLQEEEANNSTNYHKTDDKINYTNVTEQIFKQNFPPDIFHPILHLLIWHEI